MNESRNASAIFKRILLIILTFVYVVLFCYACSALKTANYKGFNLKHNIGNVFLSEDQNLVLVISSEDEASITSDKEEESGDYPIEIIDNVVFAIDEARNKKYVFVPVADNQIMWQNKNQILYKNEVSE